MADFELARDQATEARVLLEQETRFAQRLEESLRQQQQLSQLTAEENEAQRHFQHLAENLFTIKCPNPACRTALFMDQEFDSCFALKCDQCGHQCCGWCMADCGADAHPHVRKCVRNANGGNLFAPRGRSAQSVFLDAHKAARQLGVEQYLLTIDNAVVRKAVAGQVARL